MAEVSIVVPVYNEADNLRPLVDALRQAMDVDFPEYELVFIDDGSTDGTLKVLRELADEDTKIRYLSFSRNFGQQAALTAGLDFATGEAVITMDADLQDPPQLIPEMICAWKAGNDLVLMRRRKRNEGIFKRSSASLFYRLLNKFSDYKFPSDVGEFRLIDRKVADELRKFKEKTRYLRGMVFWMGYKYAIIDYDRPERRSGKSGFSLLKMVRLGMHGILNFSLLPLRFGLIVGLVAILLGFFFLIYIVVDVIVNDVYYELIKWLAVVTFIFTGFLFVLVWILGEYIGKIYNEVKNRPLYLVREKGNL